MHIAGLVLRVAIVAGTVTIVAWNHVGELVAVAVGVATAVAMVLYYRRRTVVGAD